MLGKVSSKHLVWAAVALCATLLSGCATSRYDGKHAPDPSKAIIVGSVGESFPMMQPHGLVVEIKQQGAPGTAIRLTTLGNEDDQPSPSVLGHYFMYEVPPGEYEYTQWHYVYYAGKSMPRPVPAVFSVKAGKLSISAICASMPCAFACPTSTMPRTRCRRSSASTRCSRTGTS